MLIKPKYFFQHENKIIDNHNFLYLKGKINMVAFYLRNFQN